MKRIVRQSIHLRASGATRCTLSPTTGISRLASSSSTTSSSNGKRELMSSSKAGGESDAARLLDRNSSLQSSTAAGSGSPSGAAGQGGSRAQSGGNSKGKGKLRVTDPADSAPEVEGGAHLTTVTAAEAGVSLSANSAAKQPLPSHAGGGGGGSSGGSGGDPPIPPSPSLWPSSSSLLNAASEQHPEPINPRALVSHLDSYVVGQAKAKKVLSVAVYNHYLRIRRKEEREMWEDRKAEAEMMADQFHQFHRQASAREEQSAQVPAAGPQSQVVPAATAAANAKSSPTTAAGGKKGRQSAKEAGETTKSARAARTSSPTLAPIAPAASSVPAGLGAVDVDEKTQLAAAAARAHQDVLTDYIGQASGVMRDSRGFPVPSHLATELPLKPSVEFFSSHRPAVDTPPASAAPARTKGKAGKAVAPEVSARYDVSSDTNHQPSSSMSVEDWSDAVPPQTFEKSNILLIGPTGSGKTLLMKSLAEALQVPYVHIDATPLTQAGYVGEDVEVIGHRLLAAAGWDLSRAEQGIVCIDEIDKLARRQGDSASKDVSGEGVQQGLLRILEGTTITVTGKPSSSRSEAAAPPFSNASGPWWPPHQRLGANSPDSPPSPSARRSPPSHLPSAATHAASHGPGTGAGGSGGQVTYHLDTSGILFVLSGAFVGLEKVVSDRLQNVKSSPIAASPGGQQQTLLRRALEQMQHDVEPQDLHSYGLIPEFVGRLPIVASLAELTEADLLRVLVEPKNALLAQYEALFAASDVLLKITTPALRAIAQQATQKGTGARGLRRILEDRLLDAMYSTPGSSVRFALLDEKAARGEGDVQLFARGGRHLFWTLYEDEEKGHTPIGMGIDKGEKRVSQADAQAVRHTPAGTAGNEAALEKVSAALLRKNIAAPLRRRTRVRLTKPSRIGNMRVHVMDA